MCSRADDFEDVDKGVGEGVDEEVDDIVDVTDFEAIFAHDSEAFDVASDVVDDVATDIKDVEDDIATDNVVIDFVSVADAIEVVSTNEIAERKSFEIVVDVTVETFTTANCFSDLLM